jgi:hypothetical protein
VGRAGGLVELGDQRVGVEADGSGQAADVSTGVEVSAAEPVVVVLDGADQRLADPRRLCDLLDRHPRLFPGGDQGLADGHLAIPPRTLN